MSSIGSKLDAPLIIKQAYDEPANRIRVDAAVSATISDVKITDPDGDTLEINPDGSLNVNIVQPLAVEIDATDGDNIAISDGVDTLAINPDGSINVEGTSSLKPDGSQSFVYNEVLSVGSSTPTIIGIYTALTPRLLNQVSVSGSNIAEYSILLNGSSVISKQRTYFGSALNLEMKLNVGVQLSMSDVITVNVIHFRPSLGDFNSTIYTEDQ